LTEAGRPNATVLVDRIDEEALGRLIMFSQAKFNRKIEETRQRGRAVIR